MFVRSLLLLRLWGIEVDAKTKNEDDDGNYAEDDYSGRTTTKEDDVKRGKRECWIVLPAMQSVHSEKIKSLKNRLAGFEVGVRLITGLKRLYPKVL